ncbi:MAG: RnfABCDGE type electron transport complex subunit G [bacterium]|nr:RnfABCDGE type electron transport complex subunit G [bacterium]
MKKTLQMVAVLLMVGLFSAVSLVSMFQYAQPLIEINRQRELETAILQVLPQAKSYQTLEEKEGLYKGLDSDGNPIAYAFVSEGSGYQGKIRMMVGINLELTNLLGLEVLENIETPGLGAKIDEDDFKAQFVGLTVLPQIEYVQNRIPEKPNTIQSITGATVSSRAVVRTLNKDIARIRKEQK